VWCEFLDLDLWPQFKKNVTTIHNDDIFISMRLVLLIPTMYHTGVCNSVKAYSQKSVVGHPTITPMFVIIQCLLSSIWRKDNHSNEVIFQFEITSKKFHQRESFHQERSLNTVPIVHWLPNNRNLISQQ
jgi:hypothetical protein